MLNRGILKHFYFMENQGNAAVEGAVNEVWICFPNVRGGTVVPTVPAGLRPGGAIARRYRGTCSTANTSSESCGLSRRHRAGRLLQQARRPVPLINYEEKAGR